jgi:hypothetical protein
VQFVLGAGAAVQPHSAMELSIRTWARLHPAKPEATRSAVWAPYSPQ